MPKVPGYYTRRGGIFHCEFCKVTVPEDAISSGLHRDLPTHAAAITAARGRLAQLEAHFGLVTASHPENKKSDTPAPVDLPQMDVPSQTLTPLIVTTKTGLFDPEEAKMLKTKERLAALRASIGK